MNLVHMKYAVMVAKTHSLSKAAEQLFIGQPALSRAIRELESGLGTQLFERTARGMTLTPDGEIFIAYAKSILRQVDDVETMFSEGVNGHKRFSFSGPRAGYVSDAFSSFAAQLSKEERYTLTYRETNSQRTIKNLTQDEYNLGILRFAKNYEKYYASLVEEKGLVAETVAEFSYVLVMSKDHPLAEKEEIHYEDLTPYVEIAHADPYVPNLSMAQVKKEETPANADREIYVFERATQYQLLSENKETFMWVSPTPEKTLELYGLIQRRCVDNRKVYKDILCHRKDYVLTKLDNLFITELICSKRGVMKQKVE